MSDFERACPVNSRSGYSPKVVSCCAVTTTPTVTVLMVADRNAYQPLMSISVLESDILVRRTAVRRMRMHRYTVDRARRLGTSPLALCSAGSNMRHGGWILSAGSLSARLHCAQSRLAALNVPLTRIGLPNPVTGHHFGQSLWSADLGFAC